MTNEILSEARRLHGLGFAIHWLHPKQKRPVESGWTTGPRKSWEYLESNYKEGYNLGVRLGEPSKIDGKYLAVVDVDVKSTDPKHRIEAIKCARKVLQNKICPAVSSGRGNGSRHYYCLTDTPFKTFNPDASEEMIKVHMPSKSPSKKELEALTKGELEQGLRLSKAWEVSLYSDGRQVVLPPSIHPDTGNPYVWVRECNNALSIPTIEIELPTSNKKEKSTNGNDKLLRKQNPAYSRILDQDFRCKRVELNWLPIDAKIREGIIYGRDVIDRSGYLLPAARALLNAGLDRDEILSVLTDPEYFLGQCAYEHAKTTDRGRAADWVYKYSLAKIEAERDPIEAFKNAVPIGESRDITSGERNLQTKEVESSVPWTDYLERSGKEGNFKVKNTLVNIEMILHNVFGSNCVKSNLFANTEEMWGEFPWIKDKGKEVWDMDIVHLKKYLAKKWGFEPTDEKIRNAVSLIGAENSYHPVRQWLEALPKWDEVDRLDNLLKTYIPCEGNEELREVIGRRFMVSLIKRIYEPGCQSDYILILEGAQGLRKSSAFRALIGEDWFSDASFNVQDKDAVLTIFSKWLVEFGELSVLDRATAEATKAFITRRVDRMRAPFDKKARDYPRQCLFVGSTNKQEYLKDESGNRRYWPFSLISICDTDALKRDREQLFAEALYYYTINEPTYLKEDHLRELMLDQQEEREIHDPLGEVLRRHIKKYNSDNGEPLDHFEISFIFDSGWLPGLKMDSYTTSRIGALLRKLGYEKYREGIGERRMIWKSKNSSRITMISRAVSESRRDESEEFDFR